MSGAPRVVWVVFLALASCTSTPIDRLDDADRAMLDAINCASVDELNSVYFRPGSAELDGASPEEASPRVDDTLRRLDQNVYLLTRCPQLSVAVVGHVAADESPVSRAVDALQALATARAESVQIHYLHQGIDPSRIVRVTGRVDGISVGVIYDDPALYERERARDRRVDSRPAVQ